MGEPTIWTGRRKWQGNLVPIAFMGFPVLAAIDLMWLGYAGAALAALVLAAVVGWIVTNLYGIHGSATMRRELAAILIARGEKIEAASPFVGIATPEFRSFVDSHEDVGFLFFEPEKLRFRSETREIVVLRRSVADVRFRPGAHSILGLGRWIALEGEVAHHPFRLFIEPRTEETMLRNRKASRDLIERIDRWRKRR